LGFLLSVLGGIFLSGCGNNRPPAVITPELTPTLLVGSEKAGQGGAPPTFTVQPPVATPTIDANLPLLGRRIGLDPGHGPRDDMGAVLVDPETQKLILSEDELDPTWLCDAGTYWWHAARRLC